VSKDVAGPVLRNDARVAATDAAFAAALASLFNF